jgi:hypothetical protein
MVITQENWMKVSTIASWMKVMVITQENRAKAETIGLHDKKIFSCKKQCDAS